MKGILTLNGGFFNVTLIHTRKSQNSGNEYNVRTVMNGNIIKGERYDVVGKIFIKTVTDFACRNINQAIAVVYCYGTFCTILQNICHLIRGAADHSCIKIDGNRFLLIISKANKIDIICC